MADVVLYTRQGCHPCARAEAVVRAIAQDYPLTLRKIDVDDQPDLRATYGDRVPVVVVDGQVRAEGRVSEYRLRKALGIPPTPRAWLGLARSALLGGPEST